MTTMSFLVKPTQMEVKYIREINSSHQDKSERTHCGHYDVQPLQHHALGQKNIRAIWVKPTTVRNGKKILGCYLNVLRVSVKDDECKIGRNQGNCGFSVRWPLHPSQGYSCKFVEFCELKAGETGRQPVRKGHRFRQEQGNGVGRRPNRNTVFPTRNKNMAHSCPSELSKNKMQIRSS
jgi:hypothetical protein